VTPEVIASQHPFTDDFHCGRVSAIGRGNPHEERPPDEGELMLRYNFSTFVLQRRINQPFHTVSHTIANPAIFGANCEIATSLRLDSAFRCVDAYPTPVFRADASLLSESGRRVSRVEVELSPWTPTADTELLIRPAAAHPERWSGSRARRYFSHAHQGADGLTALLLTTTVSPAVTVRR
jgi:hypothetical protein